MRIACCLLLSLKRPQHVLLHSLHAQAFSQSSSARYLCCTSSICVSIGEYAVLTLLLIWQTSAGRATHITIGSLQEWPQFEAESSSLPIIFVSQFLQFLFATDRESAWRAVARLRIDVASGRSLDSPRFAFHIDRQLQAKCQFNKPDFVRVVESARSWSFSRRSFFSTVSSPLENLKNRMEKFQQTRFSLKTRLQLESVAGRAS